MAFGISPDVLALSPSTVLQNIIQKKQLVARERERATEERLALKRIAAQEASAAEQTRQFEVSQAGRGEMTDYQKWLQENWGKLTPQQQAQEARNVAEEQRKVETYGAEKKWREEPTGAVGGIEPTAQPVVQPSIQIPTQPQILQQAGYEDLVEKWKLAENVVKNFSKPTPKAGYKRKEWLAIERTRKNNLISAKEAKISARTEAINRKKAEPRLSIAQEMAVKQQRNQALSMINSGNIPTVEDGKEVIGKAPNREAMKNAVLAVGLDVNTDSKLKAALDNKFPAYKEVEQAIDEMFTTGKALTADELVAEISTINTMQDLKPMEKKTLIKKIQSKQTAIEIKLKIPSAQRIGKMVGKMARGIIPKPLTPVETGMLAAGGTLGLPAVMTKRLAERFGSKMGANLTEFMKGLAGE